MKKIIVMAVSAILSTFLFAQNAEYEKHFEKAKEYESQKKWIYALGEYYDAMTAKLAETNIENFESYEGWINIADKINNGNPGIGEYDDFDYVDSWLLLLQEYERYWTENCPKTIYFDKPVRTELNREKKTADYSITINQIDNLKFQEIDKIIQNGFKKAYKDDWNIKYLKDWPKVSFYSDKKYDGKYFIDGTALTSYCTITDRLNPDGGSTTYISEELLASLHSKSVQKKIHTQRYNAALTPIQEWTYLDEKHPARKLFNYDYDGSSEVSLYDIKFSLRDNSNNILLQSSRYNIAIKDSSYCKHVYEFKNVPQETMKLIEAGEVNCIVDELYLNYGKIDDLVMANNRSYLKDLPDLKIEHYSSKTWLEEKRSDNSSVYKIKKLKEEYERTESKKKLAEENQKREEEEKIQNEKEEIKQAFEAFEQQIIRNIEVLGEFPIIGITKEKKTPAYFVQSYNEIYHGFGGNYSKLTEKYGSEKLSSVLGYISCNRKSRAENLEPYYEIDGVGINNYNSEEELFLENFDLIITNPLSNGWHFPSSDEKEYVKKKRTSEEKKNNVGSLLGIGGTSNKPSLLMLKDREIETGDFIIRIEK